MFYRFISDEELKNLQDGKTIKSKNYEGLIHCLNSNIMGILLPEELNYNVDISEFDDVSKKYKVIQLSIDEAEFLMSGVVSNDHLVVLENVNVVSEKLGWYYWDEDDNNNITECALIETLIESYSLENLKQIIY